MSNIMFVNFITGH